MKKYKCPYCENISFSLWQKTIAGGMASKGQACPECGKHAVHGMKSTIFRTSVMTVVFIIILINCFSKTPDLILCIAALAGAFIISKIANGLFFELEMNNRKDIR